MKKTVPQESISLFGAAALALMSIFLMNGSPLVVLPLALSAALVLTSLYLFRKKRELDEITEELESLRVNTESMVESLSSGLITIDADGKILFFNRAGREIMGIRETKVRGFFLREVFSEDQTAFVEKLFETYLRGEGKRRFEISFAKTSGERIPLGVTTSILRERDAGKKGVVAVFQDLTQVKKSEETSRSKERLVAIGELSAVMAHEIRNSLGPISGSIELLVQEPEISKSNKRLFSIVSTETRRLQKFVSEVLEYAEDRATRFEGADIETLLRDVVATSMRHPSYSEGIAVKMSCEPEGLTAKLDSDLMRRALLNLAINAFDAMGMVGTLRVEASREQQESQDGYEGERENEEELVVRFMDNGSGMNEKELKKALEPFFSTKRGGTGLGLSIVQKVVEKHGGTLEIESTKGAGTIVTIRIPIQEDELLEISRYSESEKGAGR